MNTNKRPWSPPQMIWSAVIATVVWTAVGFSWFGYGFDWSTDISARRMSAAAVTDARAEICAAQARSSPEFESRLGRLSELEIWKRRDYVEEARWATMPGDESAAGGVADLCIEKLLAT